MKIAIYSRKSKFTGIGDSIENQVSMCKDFAMTKFRTEELEFDEYEDEGFTGSNLNRPKFKELIKNIKKYDVLICYRLDRISRNVADFSSTLEILQNNHCDFISIREQFDTSSPMGRAMIYIASVFAQLERETIAERIRDNMLEMGKNGHWTGGRTPLGYDSEKTTWVDAEGNERKSVNLVINEEEAKLVHMVYDVYLKEGSLHKTEVWFTNHNIKSKKSILFEKTSLKLILQNPVYVKSTPEAAIFLKNDGWNVYGEPDGIHGFLSYNKTESVNVNGKTTKRLKDKSEWIASISNVPGIIGSDTWLMVQRQFQRNKDTFPNLAKTNNALLTGILKCAKCNNPMIIVHGRISKKTGKKLFYYTCSMKKRSRSTLCNSKNVKANEIEDSVLIELEKIYEHKKEFLDNAKKKFIKTEKEQSAILKKQSAEKQIKDRKKQIDQLVNKLTIDDSIADILISKIKSIKEEIKTFENEIQKINEDLLSTSQEIINIDFIEKIFNKCTNIRSLSRDEQKTIINLVIDSIYYDSYNNGVVINFIGSEKKSRI